MSQTTVRISHELLGEFVQPLSTLKDATFQDAYVTHTKDWRHWALFDFGVNDHVPDISHIGEKIHLLHGMLPPEQLVDEREHARNDGISDVIISKNLSGVFNLLTGESLSASDREKRDEYCQLRDLGIHFPLSGHVVEPSYTSTPDGFLEYYWDPVWDIIYFSYPDDQARSFPPLHLDHVVFLHEPNMQDRIDTIKKRFLSMEHDKDGNNTRLEVHSFQERTHSSLVQPETGLHIVDAKIVRSGSVTEAKKGKLPNWDICYRLIDSDKPVPFDQDDISLPALIDEHDIDVVDNQIATFEELYISEDHIALETNNRQFATSRRVCELAEFLLVRVRDEASPRAID